MGIHCIPGFIHLYFLCLVLFAVCNVVYEKHRLFPPSPAGGELLAGAGGTADAGPHLADEMVRRSARRLADELLRMAARNDAPLLQGDGGGRASLTPGGTGIDNGLHFSG